MMKKGTRWSRRICWLPSMPPLERDEEEAKEGKGLKIWTPNKLLTRLPAILAQIKTVNKLKTN